MNDRFETLKDLIEQRGLGSRSTIYRRMAAFDPDDPDAFPQPAKLGKRLVWSAREIDQYMAAQLARRPHQIQEN